MKAKLVNEKLPFEMVEFDFNPETLKYTRTSESTTRAGASPAGVGSTPSILLKAPPKSLNIFANVGMMNSSMKVVAPPATKRTMAG